MAENPRGFIRNETIAQHVVRQLKKPMNTKRNIKEIAPLLADDFVDLEESIFDTDLYSAFLTKNSEKLGVFNKYLICKLHDSWIINIINRNDSFLIELNDFSTYVFAHSIIDKFELSIDPDCISFPIKIELKGNLKLEYNKVDDFGNLIEIEPLKLDEYLYEQVSKIENNRIEIVFHFWKSNLDTEKPGERIIVIASAKNIVLTENQDKAWNEIFGNKYDKYYEYFKLQFDSDRYVSDHNECAKLITEFENKKNE